MKGIVDDEEEPVLQVVDGKKENPTNKNVDIELEDANNNTATNDHSETVSIANDEDASTAIPTRMEIFYDLNGSLGFVVGSSGFILAMYFTNWLPYFRYGSLVWIWGCVMYSVPLLLKIKSKKEHQHPQDRERYSCSFACSCLEDYSKDSNPRRSCGASSCPWGIGDFGEFLCYLFYVIGCVLGGFFDEEKVEEFLPVINHMFLYGSLSLALEPVNRVLLFLLKMRKEGGGGGPNISRTERTTKLRDLTSPTTTNIDDTENNNTSNGISSNTANNNKMAAALPVMLPKEINWDRCFELCATTFFIAAGIFGGFPPHPSLALPGVYFWEVGSFFSLARSFLMIYERNKGLKKALKCVIDS